MAQQFYSPLQLNSTLTVGVDDTGYDVIFYGATSGKHMHWDEDSNGGRLNLNGGADLYINQGHLHMSQGSYYFKNASTGTQRHGFVADGQYAFENVDLRIQATQKLYLDGGSNTYITEGAGDHISFVTGASTAVQIDSNQSLKVISGSLQISGDNANFATLTETGAGILTIATVDALVLDSADDITLDAAGNDVMFKDAGTHIGTINMSSSNLSILSSVSDKDIIFKGKDDSSDITALTLDMSDAGTAIFNHDIKLSDSGKVRLGSSNDLEVYHNGTASYVTNDTGHLNIENNHDDGDIVLKTDDGSGGLTAYLTLDGGLGYTTAQKAIKFLDNVSAAFGTGGNGDYGITHDGTDTKHENYTGDLKFINYTDDKDIIFQSDDGSGGVETYFMLDGSFGVTKFPDNKKLAFGNGLDVQVYHDGTNSYFYNQGGDLYIQNATDDKDIIFQSDDGSGGMTTYFQLDGGEGRTVFKQNALWEDSKAIYMGNGADLRLYHNGSNSFIENHLGNLTIDSAADDADIIFKGTDGGADITALTLDMSAAGAATFNNFVDATNFKIGGAQGTDGQVLTSTGSGVAWEDAAGGSLSGNNFATDLKIGYDAHNLIDFTTDDEITFRINNSNELKLNATSLHPTTTNGLGLGTATLRWSDLFLASGAVVNFNNGDVTMTHSSNLITIDGGDLTLTEHLNLADAKNIDFGNDTDFQIQHSGSHGIIKNHTGDLKIINYADDGDLLFYTDDDSGGITEYFRCDGGTKTIEIAQTTNFLTDKALRFGTSSTFIEGATSGTKLMLNGQTDIFMRINGTTILQLDPNKAELAKPLDITDTTDSTDATGDTGALRCEGGGSIAKKLYVGTDLTVSGNITANGSIIGDDNTSITNISSIGADSYTADADATTTINMGASQIDCLVADTDVFQVTDSAFTFDPAVKTSIHKRHFAKTTNTDGDADGDIVYFGGTTSMTAGKLYYYKSDGTWAQTDADAASTSTGLLAVALGAASDTNGMLLRGMVTVNNIGGTEAVGDILYVALATGDVTKTVPSGSGDIVRVVGYCLDATNGQIWFNPDGAFVEIA